MTDEKPLEEYTVKQLKEMAREMEGIEGVSAMKKDELLAAIKVVKEIPAKEAKTKPLKVKKDQPLQTIATIKEEIRLLKEKRDKSREERNKVSLGRLKRRVKKLKKKTRKMAKSATS